jgi:CubicO group peptidase (beta-lactamase class C family)
MAKAWTKAGLARLDEVMAGHVERTDVPGLVWLVSRRGEVHAGAAGTGGAGAGAAVGRDTIFRISSTTKPIVAAAALVLIEECRLRLDDPVDDLLPELADRQVLARPDAPLDDTVPAERPISVRDVLTFRLGHGSDFANWSPTPLSEAMAALGLGEGPPAPAGPPAPDEWMRRLGSVPLQSQPGERWLYNVGADVLGVLVARAAGQPLGTFLAERVFGPLGMVDTAFSVPADRRDRFGPCWWTDGATGERAVYDPPDGQWATPPAFPSGAAGLVSTVDDLHRFAAVLLAGGERHGVRLLARPTVAAMTTNQLTPAQMAAMAPDPSDATGWGLGVGVEVRGGSPTRSPGTYGWDGGLGSSWANDPSEDLIGVLLTNRAWASPTPPAAFRDFWTATYAAFAD